MLDRRNAPRPVSRLRILKKLEDNGFHAVLRSCNVTQSDVAFVVQQAGQVVVVRVGVEQGVIDRFMYG